MRWIEDIGRRGGALIALAIVQIVYAWTIIADTPEVYVHLPIVNAVTSTAAGFLMIGLASVMILFSFYRNGRDSWGFTVGLISPTIWGLAFLFSGILGHYPTGLGTSLRQSFLWLGYSVLILIISGMIGVGELTDHAEHGDRDEKDRHG